MAPHITMTQNVFASGKNLNRAPPNLPGVESVGATSELPLNGEHNDNAFYIAGHTYAPSEFDDANFRLGQQQLLRDDAHPVFSPAAASPIKTPQTPPAPWSSTRRSLNNISREQNPIGKHLRFATGPKQDMEIVGVVGNIHHDSLSDSRLPEMYFRVRAKSRGANAHRRSRLPRIPKISPPRCEKSSANIDKDETLSDFRTLDAIRDASIAQPRFSTQLLGTFAALALILAAVGLYGLMAYSVTQRINEIGIRVALGATRSNILSLILRRGSLLALDGIAIGLDRIARPLAPPLHLSLRRAPHRPDHVLRRSRDPGRRSPDRQLHPRPPRHPGRPQHQPPPRMKSGEVRKTSDEHTILCKSSVPKPIARAVACSAH